MHFDIKKEFERLNLIKIVSHYIRDFLNVKVH